MSLNNQSSSLIPKQVLIGGIIGLLGLCLCLIVSVIILSLIPVYLSHRNTQPLSSSTSTPNFNVTYLVLNGDVSSLTNINSIDQTRTAQSFAQGLSLSQTDSLQIQDLSQDTIVASSRRKRLIQCDRGSTNVNGTGLIFQFNLNYPSRLFCQTDSCKNKTFTEIYQRFADVSELSVELAGAILQLRLCSLGIIPIIGPVPNVTSNVWKFATNMSCPRYQPSTTLTTEGNSVVISGSSSIYNFPSASISTIDTLNKNGSLISSKSMSYIRNFHTTNYLPSSSSNLILFAGGINAPDGTKLNNAELFDLNAGTTKLINMSSIRFDHQSAIVNSSNKIILIGGTNENGTVSNSGDVFDGNTFTSVLNQMTYGRRYHTVTYLPTLNKILIIGGETTINCTPNILNTIELYNIDTNMFESSINITMLSPRSLHTATYIPSPYNQVLILGGSSNGTNTLNTYEIFNISNLSFIKNGTIQSARAAHTATLLKNNIEILIVGGYSSNEAIDISYQPIASCEIFNMTTTSTTTIVANINVPRAFHTAVLLPNTTDVLCCGGVDSNNNPLASCERYTP